MSHQLAAPYGTSPDLDDCPGAFLHEAEQIATALDDRRRLGRVSAHLAREFTFAGEHDRAIERAKRALAIAADRSAPKNSL